jgi:hypothetical protein
VQESGWQGRLGWHSTTWRTLIGRISWRGRWRGRGPAVDHGSLVHGGPAKGVRPDLTRTVDHRSIGWRKSKSSGPIRKEKDLNARISTGGRVWLWFQKTQGPFCKVAAATLGWPVPGPFDRGWGAICTLITDRAARDARKGRGGGGTAAARRGIVGVAQTRASGHGLGRDLVLREAGVTEDLSRWSRGRLRRPWRLAPRGGGTTTPTSAGGVERAERAG